MGERGMSEPTGETKATRRQASKRTADDISAIMRRVHGRDTTPEMRLRRALWARGLRYSVANDTLPGKPDIIFPAARLAVFVDGDYWHGNQWRRRGKLALEEQFAASAEASRAYWLRKIRRNMRRDCEATAALLRDGWTTLRLWESQITADLEGCVSLIADTLADQRGENGPAPTTLRARLPQKTCAEFFAGIGLMRLGLERQGWRVTFANDIDERKRAMYLAHFAPDGIGAHPTSRWVMCMRYRGARAERDTGHGELPLQRPLAGGRTAGAGGRALLRVLGLHPHTR